MSVAIEIYDGKAGWTLAEPLDREVYPPEVMATVIWRDVIWAHADRRFFARLDDELVCHVGLYLRKAKCDGREVFIGGIGGVMTRAIARRRGCAGRAMQAAAAKMKDEGCDFGLLFCEPHNLAFYEGLGWLAFGGDVFCEQPAGRIKFDLMPAMVLPVHSTPQGSEIDLCGLPW